MSLRSVVPALLLLSSLFLLTPHVRAGTYVWTGTTIDPKTGKTLQSPTYTAGTHTDAGKPAAQDGPMNGPNWGGVATVVYGGGGTNSGTASCEGTISATLTWMHYPGSGENDQNDPPPTVELVQEMCDTNWKSDQTSSIPGYSVSGKFSNPFWIGPAPSGGFSGDESGVKYSMQGGQTFSLSETIKCSVTGAGAPPSTTLCTGQAKVVYAVSGVSPLSLKIDGTNNPAAGDYHVLTGQQIKASVVGIPANFTVTKYTWQGTSGTCFKTYNEKAPSNPLVPLSSADFTGPATGSTSVAALNFYDSKQEDLTLTCAVTMLTPDGKTTLNFSATSPPINVLKPTVAAWGINTGKGPQQGIPSGFVQVGINTDPKGNSFYTMYADELWGPITITVPQPFPSGSGMGCIAQIITAEGDSATRVPIGSAPTTYVDVVKNTSGQYVAPSTPALDTALPFPFGYNLGTNGVINTMNTGSSAFDVSTSGYSGDEPDLPIFPAGGAGGNNWTKTFFSSTYNTYVMYQPPSGVWVPLQEMTWTYSLTAQPSASGSITDPYNNAPWATSTPVFSGGSPVNQNTPPSWASIEATPLYFGPLSQ